MSRKLSNTIEPSIKPSEDRQFIYADGEYNITRPSWVSLESSLSCLKIWVRS
jgi:hypothetical protein